MASEFSASEEEDTEREAGRWSVRGNGGAERRGVSKRGGGREGEIEGRREGENFNLKRGAGGWRQGVCV